MVERRTFIAMVSGGLLVAPLAAGAQPRGWGNQSSGSVLPIHTTQQVPRRSSRRTVAGKPRRPILLAKSSAECRREKAGRRIQVSPEPVEGLPT
jgi:hypothetical protein